MEFNLENFKKLVEKVGYRFSVFGDYFTVDNFEIHINRVFYKSYMISRSDEFYNLLEDLETEKVKEQRDKVIQEASIRLEELLK